MGQFAGLEIALITGKTLQEGQDAQDFELGLGHMWTAVKIDGHWQFVDPTFAIAGENVEVLDDVARKREYQRIVKKRSKRTSSVKQPREDRYVDDTWFLTNKYEMIKTHFPDNENWQLLEKKVSKQEFLGLSDKEYKLLLKRTSKKKKEDAK